MLEKVLERILQRYLAPYVDGISKDGIAVLSGNLEFKDLSLKVDAFDFLRKGGILLRFGRVGRLRIHVPWRRLASAQISIELEVLEVNAERIATELPTEEQIIAEFRAAREKKVEKKMRKLQEMAEAMENQGADGAKNPGYVGRWTQRLLQNLQITMTGGVLARVSDPLTHISGGVLVKSLTLESAGDAKVPAEEQYTVLQKLCEITDIAVFVAVHGTALRYAAEPTSVRLHIDQRASALKVQLEVLEQIRQGASCGIAMSRAALFCAACAVQSMNAWSQHIKDITTREASTVRTHETALTGETHTEYTMLLRRKLVNKDLTAVEVDRLNAIQDTVLTRHLARWRLEVMKQVDVAQQRKITRQSNDQSGGQKFVSESEWSQIVAQVEGDMAHLAHLSPPEDIDITCEVARFGLRLYDDGTILESLGPGLSLSDDEGAKQPGYAELCETLDNNYNFAENACSEMSLTFMNFKAAASLNPRVIADHERMEWSASCSVSGVGLACNGAEVLQYSGDNSVVDHGIRFKSKVQEDGAELISTHISLTPLRAHVSPEMASAALKLFVLELPPPPHYEQRRSVICLPMKQEGDQVSEWLDEWQEQAQQQVDRVKGSELKFMVDISFAAPQLTVLLDEASRIEINLGHIHVHSSDEMTAHNFAVDVELKNTQVTCIVDTAVGTSSYTVLEPISLSIRLQGHKISPLLTSRSSTDHALHMRPSHVEVDELSEFDLTVEVTLIKLSLIVYPQAAQLILLLPRVYMPAFSVIKRDDAVDVSSTALDDSKKSPQTVLQVPKRRTSTSSQRSSKKTPRRAEVSPGFLNVHATASFELVSLTLFDTTHNEVGRGEARSLRATVEMAATGDVDAGLALHGFLVDVMGQPLVFMKSKDTVIDVGIQQRRNFPLKVTTTLCPVEINWRKATIAALVGVADQCTPPPPPPAPVPQTEDSACEDAPTPRELGQGRRLSSASAADIGGAIRRATVHALKGLQHAVVVVPSNSDDSRKSSFSSSVGANEVFDLAAPKIRDPPLEDDSTLLARSGLSAEGDFPPLQAETRPSDQPIPLALEVEAYFGGLALKMHRDEAEQALLCPAWRGVSDEPLIQAFATGTSCKFATYVNGEASGHASLETMSILYDGQCVVAPFFHDSNIVDLSFKCYLPRPEGPAHSICLRGVFRQISVVFFMKMLDSFLEYLSNSIFQALLQQAAEVAGEVAQTATKNVALWCFKVESPSMYGATDEALLRHSPAWDHSVDHVKVAHGRRNHNERFETSIGDRRGSVTSEGSEFEDAMDHPTPIVETFKRYILLHPGVLNVSNKYAVETWEHDPQLLIQLFVKEMYWEGWEKDGPCKHMIWMPVDWDMTVRLGFGTPSHYALGFHFERIQWKLTHASIALVMGFVSENVCYWKYFPVPSNTDAPESLASAEVPDFAKRSGNLSKSSHVHQPLAETGQHENLYESMQINIRWQLDDVSLKLVWVKSPSACVSCEEEEELECPLLGGQLKMVRMTFDSYHFYNNKPMLYRYAMFVGSLNVDDLRPDKFRGSTDRKALVCPKDGGDFDVGDWNLVVTRGEGRTLYEPDAKALMLFYQVSSATSSMFSVELVAPRLAMFLTLYTEAMDVFVQGIWRSTFWVFPGPPLQDPEVMPERRVSVKEAPANVSQTVVMFSDAELWFYTDCHTPGTPVVELLGTVNLKLEYVRNTTRIRDLSFHNFSIRRTETGHASTDVSRPVRPASVYLTKISALTVVGSYERPPDLLFDVLIHAAPLTVCLTTLDVPHLLAAFSGPGGLWCDGGEYHLKELYKLPYPPGLRGNPDEQVTKAAAPSTRSFDGAVGILCLTVVRVHGLSALSQNIKDIVISVRFGDGPPTVVELGIEHSIPVPPMRGQHSSGTDARQAPMLLLQLQSGGSSGPVVIGTLRFPVELCSGTGLDTCVLMKTELPSNGKSSEFLKATHKGTVSNDQLKLEFQAKYSLLTANAQKVTSVGGFDEPLEFMEDFICLTQNLSDFLDDDQLPALLNARTQEDVVDEPNRVTYMRLCALLEGLEFSFLDDCNATVLPVLRVFVSAKSTRELSKITASSLFELLDEFDEGFGGVMLKRNPINDDGEQRLGTDLCVEDCVFGLEYLNTRAGCWEPFLERWVFDLFLKNLAETHSTPAIQEVTVASFSPLNLNVSPELCSLAALFLNNSEQYIARFKGELSEQSASLHDHAAGARYRLLNLTDIPVRIAFVRSGTGRRVEVPDGAEGVQGKTWHEFLPTNSEIALDPLLGYRSAEEQRTSADEELMCTIQFAGQPIGRPSAVSWDAEEEHAPMTSHDFSTTLSLSSSCDGILRPNPAMMSEVIGACEVLAPHPSHKVLLITSGLRVFNHIDRHVEVQFVCSEEVNIDPSSVPFAAPLELCPKAFVRPPEISEMLPSEAEVVKARLSNTAEIASRRSCRSPASALRSKSLGSFGEILVEQTNPDEVDGPDVAESWSNRLENEDPCTVLQHVPPLHFCSAPLVASEAISIRIRLQGTDAWSSPIVLSEPDGKVEHRGETVLVSSDEGDNSLRMHVHLRFPRLESHVADHVVKSVHICAPMQLINTTPVRLCFDFQVPAYQEKHRIEVDAFSVFNAPTCIDPTVPYGLSLSLAEDVDVLAPGMEDNNQAMPWRPSKLLHKVFVPGASNEEVVRVPLAREVNADQGQNAAGRKARRPPEPAAETLRMLVRKGLAIRVTCSRWLVDRTGLGLRMILSRRKPTNTSPPIPMVSGHLMLLESYLGAMAPGDRPEKNLFLAVPETDGLGWGAMVPVKLPDGNGSFTHATLAKPKKVNLNNRNNVPSTSWSDDVKENTYPAHVCLQMESLSLQLTLGVPCGIVSILPQVVVYNELTNDDITVRAAEDSATEIVVQSGNSASFLYWKPKSQTHADSRARVALQFRPCSLSTLVNWSTPIELTETSVGSLALMLLLSNRYKPVHNDSRMFKVEVAERSGVMFLTVRQGSQYELRNFSRLAELVVVTPVMSDAAPEESVEFCARQGESVEFALASLESDQKMEVALTWVATVGGGRSAKQAFHMSGQRERLIFPAPMGCQAVVVVVGSDGDSKWMQVDDVLLDDNNDIAVVESDVKRKAQPKARLGVTLSSVSVSLISERRACELLFAEVQQVGVFVNVWEEERSLDVVVSNVQVDCQLLDYSDIPVVFANRAEQNVPWLRVSCLQRWPTSSGVLSFPRLIIHTDAMEISLNDDLLGEVQDAIVDLLRPLHLSGGVNKKQLEAWKTNPLEGCEAPPSVPLQVTVDELLLIGLEFRLWLTLRVASFPAALRGVLALLVAGSSNFSVRGAHLKLEAEAFYGVEGLLPVVLKKFFFRYWTDILASLGSALGSSTLVDIPSLPLSWSRQGVRGVMRAFEFMLNKATDVLEMLTLDENYVKNKKLERQQRLHAVTGFRRGVSTSTLHAARSLLSFGDVVRAPVRGAREEGVFGFITGLYKGVAGAVVKPIIETGYGVRSLAKGFAACAEETDTGAHRVALRRRPPRVMYNAGGIREYDEAAAHLTQEFTIAPLVAGSSAADMLVIDHARNGISDHVVVKERGATPYLDHLLLLLTPTHLILVEMDSSGISVLWSLALARYRLFIVCSHGVLINAEQNLGKRREQRSVKVVRVGPRKGVYLQVPCDSAKVIQAVCKMLRPLRRTGL